MCVVGQTITVLCVCAASPNCILLTTTKRLPLSLAWRERESDSIDSHPFVSGSSRRIDSKLARTRRQSTARQTNPSEQYTFPDRVCTRVHVCVCGRYFEASSFKSTRSTAMTFNRGSMQRGEKHPYRDLLACLLVVVV